METYQKSYFTLLHATTESVENLNQLLVLENLSQNIRVKLQEEISRLTLAQIKAEDEFIKES